MKNLKSLALTTLVGVICFSAGKFLTKPRVEIKEVEKVVYREVSATKTDTNRTVDKKETIMPDGTRIIETSSSTQRTSDKRVDTSFSKENERLSLTENRKDWHVTLTYVPVIPGYQESYSKSIPLYSLGIQRRILSEIYLGASVSSDKHVGVSIGIGF